MNDDERDANPSRRMRALVAAGVLALAPAAAVGGDSTIEYLPRGSVYPPALAGPHQRGFAATWSSLSETAEGTGDQVFGLRLGGRFPLLNVLPHGNFDQAWQFSFDAGFYGQFDIGDSQDNLGWDGFYGAAVARSLGPSLVLQLGAFHDSSHVGDEYAERTGRKRIDYTREELALGASWRLARHWRAYGEGAMAYKRANTELQERGRVEAGLEYESSPVLFQRHTSWYVAGDANALQEQDWEPDLSLQVGLATYSGPRRWRAAAEYYDGRFPIGELSFEGQRGLTLGVYLDLDARPVRPGCDETRSGSQE